jgi:hypothetical protein
MTRTAIRNTLSALAAAALISAFAASPASAQSGSQINNMMNNNLQMPPAQSKAKGESTEGLTTKQQGEVKKPENPVIFWMLNQKGS